MPPVSGRMYTHMHTDVNYKHYASVRARHPLGLAYFAYTMSSGFIRVVTNGEISFYLKVE